MCIQKSKVVHVKLPTYNERISILQVHMRSLKLVNGSNVDNISRILATECEGYSGADLSNLVRAAASRCLKSPEDYVNLEHFLEAKRFDVVKPSSDASLLSRLKQWKP